MKCFAQAYCMSMSLLFRFLPFPLAVQPAFFYAISLCLHVALPVLSIRSTNLLCNTFHLYSYHLLLDLKKGWHNHGTDRITGQSCLDYRGQSRHRRCYGEGAGSRGHSRSHQLPAHAAAQGQHRRAGTRNTVSLRRTARTRSRRGRAGYSHTRHLGIDLPRP